MSGLTVSTRAYRATVGQVAECALVECHVQLDDVPSEFEAGVSLTMSQLHELCEAVG